LPQNGSEKRCLRDEAHQQGNFFQIKYQNKKGRQKFIIKKQVQGTVEVGIHLVAKKKLQLEKQVTTGIKGQEDG